VPLNIEGGWLVVDGRDHDLSVSAERSDHVGWHLLLSVFERVQLKRWLVVSQHDRAAGLDRRRHALAGDLGQADALLLLQHFDALATAYPL